MFDNYIFVSGNQMFIESLIEICVLQFKIHKNQNKDNKKWLYVSQEFYVKKDTKMSTESGLENH